MRPEHHNESIFMTLKTTKDITTEEYKRDSLIPMIIEGITDRKGRDIVLLDLSEIESAPAPEFIVCQGTSTQNVASIADSVRDYLLEHAGVKPYNYDGYRNSQWIVIDYGEIMVHVFTPEARQMYNLEELWSDARITAVPDLD